MQDKNDLPVDDTQTNEEHESTHDHHGHHDQCCEGHHDHHGPHQGPMDGQHGPGGPGGHHKGEIPPHIMREIMDMKEKIGKLEGMLEVIMKKM